MKQRPILFSTDMVKAILEDRKTMTRRVVKSDANVIQWMPIVLNGYGGFCDEHGNPVKCPYGKEGDLLWVKETFTVLEPEHCAGMKDRFWYKADVDIIQNDRRLEYIAEGYFYKWKPSLFMPKEAARIWLEITDVKVERLQDISEEDAIREGVEVIEQCESYKDYLGTVDWYGCAVNSFKSLWIKINGEASFNLNPFVWVISFEVLSKTGKQLTA